MNNETIEFRGCPTCEGPAQAIATPDGVRYRHVDLRAATLRQAARVDEGAIREAIEWHKRQARTIRSNYVDDAAVGERFASIHDDQADKLEAALSTQPSITGSVSPQMADARACTPTLAQPAERQGETTPAAWMCETVNGYTAFSRDGSFPCNVGKVTPLYAHPAAPVGVSNVRVDKQGVRFGDGCWYSHERITGVSADLLNEGKCSITAREYMKWVQKHIAAAPSAPQGVE